MNKLISRIKELIKETDIDYLELSKILNLSSVNVIYPWVRGETLPNLDNLIKMADHFKVSLDYLMGRSEDNSEPTFKHRIPFDIQLKKIMKEKGKTQYKMAKDKVAAPNHFNYWFVRKSEPKLDTVIKLADYFDVSIDYLVGRE